MNTIDCKEIAESIYDKAAIEGIEYAHLYIIYAGNDEASAQYVNNKIKRLNKRFVKTTLAKFDEDVTEKTLIDEVIKAREMHDVTGIIVEMPLPKHINVNNVVSEIPAKKDVDGLNVDTAKTIYEGQINYPCCAAAIIEIFNTLKIDSDAKIVVAGRSKLVGRGVITTLESMGYYVDNINSTTTNNDELFTNADVVISATGHFNITNDVVLKEGVIIIDAGTNFVKDKCVGDIDTECFPFDYLATPVPGGVGLVTNALLFKNIVGYRK